MKQKYRYSGPVMLFGRIVTTNWYGETWAVSEGKARSNLAYQFKTTNNRVPSSAITLPGKLVAC